MKYVLITPARNEETFIRKVLDSVAAQTQPPERWVIVDDGSTDETAEIVEGYARRIPWIELVRRPQHTERSFAGKVHAFNAGFERVKDVDFDVVGNLDADLSFEPDYLEFLMRKFSEDEKLGVAGTPFIEEGYDSTRDSFEGENHVAGGCQMFRRQCFQEIGGYIANRAGGIDWIAVTSARMKGWRDPFFRRETVSPLPDVGHCRTRSSCGAVLLRGEGLLPRWISGLATVPCRLSNDQETASAWRSRLTAGLLLGGFAPDETGRNPGIDAVSSG